MPLALKLSIRQLLIIGGLIGLVFSRAEGISLLPFPETDVLAVSEHLRPDAGIEYGQTLKSGNSSKHSTGKTKHAFPDSDGGRADWSVEPSFVSFAPIVSDYAPRTAVSRRITGSPVTRGPPAA